MIDIVREKSGKQNIIFIVDEVGQYVASRDNLTATSVSDWKG